ncbi:MAG: T9SS type A sorting domain-containing protein [candidate division Zixibacteria bacterium]|nr:T9SS type A sorting domain-containing protein [candidate division Zixibacteria bacterium]MDH4033267.1 T9SS type A sorting domain-containing protein [candidate division Zixibacteria bacterium]
MTEESDRKQCWRFIRSTNRRHAALPIMMVLLSLLAIVLFSDGAHTENSPDPGQEVSADRDHGGEEAFTGFTVNHESRFFHRRLFNFFRNLFRQIRNIFREFVDFLEDILGEILGWLKTCFNALIGQHVRARAVGLVGAPAVNDGTFNDVMLARIRAADRIWSGEARINIEPALNVFHRRYPTMADPVGLYGQPGDILNPDDAVDRLDFLYTMLLADLLTTSATWPQGPITVHCRDFIDHNGAHSEHIGWAIIGNPLAPWSAVVDPATILTVYGNQTEADAAERTIYAHELGHTFSLPDLDNEPDNLMQGQIEGGDHLDRGQRNRAKKYQFGTNWIRNFFGSVLTCLGFKDGNDLPRDIYRGRFFDELFEPDSLYEGAPQINILVVSLVQRSDSGNFFEIIVPELPDNLNTTTSYFFMLDNDEDTLTGGDPSGLGLSGAPTVAGIEIVGMVGIDINGTVNSAEARIWRWEDGPGFQEITDASCSSSISTIYAVGARKDGTADTVKFMERVLLRTDSLLADTSGVIMKAASWDQATGLTDTTHSEILTFDDASTPKVTVDPEITCAGGKITLEVDYMLPESRLTLSIEDASVDIGDVYTDTSGHAVFTAHIPDTAEAGFNSITVGHDTTGIRATTVVLVEIGFSMRIEKTHSTIQGQIETVDVVMERSGDDFAAFDLLIAYDASAMNFQSATPGAALYDSCGWEYFTYRTGPFGNCGDACPSGMIRLVGLAETNNGPNHPQCFSPDSSMDEDGVVIATLDFLVSNDRTLECQYAPIRFYWMDCGDNLISSVTGDTAFVTAKIYDYDSTMVWNELRRDIYPEDNRPFGVGTPDSCVVGDGEDKPGPKRCVSFRHGGIDIVCADSIDDRGDINLNGVVNEVADAVLYSNYFVHGISVFNVNIDGQIAASDVNADGITLSVADLVYQIRIITGDAPPYPKLSPEPAKADLANGVLSVDGEMGAAYVVVQSSITPHLLAESMEMKYNYDADHDLTRILVYSMEKDRRFSGGFLGGIDGNVMTLEMATYEGRPVTTKLVPDEFALYPSYPNPFNPVATISFALASSVDYELVIYNSLGQTVKTFSDHSGPGLERIDWNASGFASGVYFYRLTAGDFTDTRKMVLLK